MIPIFEAIRKLASPYLDTRDNEIHTDIAIRYAFEVLRLESENEEVNEYLNEDIVIPAIILHDIGWKNVLKKIQSNSFGPFKKEGSYKLHSDEGVKIAKLILMKINYDKVMSDEILKIIKFHDSKEEPISINDRIVRDSDKLWRFSKDGFSIDCKRFNQTIEERINAEDMQLDLFYTNYAKEIAKQEINKRLKEVEKIK